MTNVAAGTEMLLASLVAQADGRGVDLITLRALVEESSQAGARRALASLGLDDERARRDMDELRELLSAWRDAKRSAWRAVVTWAVRLVLAMLLIGIAVRLRLTDLISVTHAATGALATASRRWHGRAAETGAAVISAGSAGTTIDLEARRDVGRILEALRRYGVMET
jgi:choline dehydrogenase-like flavoprotein